MRKRFFQALILVIVLSARAVYADRGSIPFNPHAHIFEPKQRAMIAWNGREEILLLSTDLRASRPTKVLEVLPLPSEPKVKKGDVQVFKRANAIINRKLRERRIQALKRKGKIIPPKAPAGEVTFHKKIGAHDISVTRVLSTEGFIGWVEKYLRSAGVGNPQIPAAMKSVVREYLREGFKWFVFDVVSLDVRPKTNQAIQYRFKTKSLYYPLKITRTEKGNTTIDLLVLTPKLLSKFPGYPIQKVRLRHQPVTLNRRELRSLSKDMDALLGHRKSTKLRIWQIQGRLSSFREDLIAM